MKKKATYLSDKIQTEMALDVTPKIQWEALY
jgi:hypothetical protein